MKCIITAKGSPSNQNRTTRKVSSRGTRLIPIALEREGFPAEIIYMPECVACGEVILDLRAANISTVGATDEPLVPLGQLGGAKASLIPSAGAFAVHKECDETARAPWISADCVIRNDQRREFERPGRRIR